MRNGTCQPEVEDRGWYSRIVNLQGPNGFPVWRKGTEYFEERDYSYMVPVKRWQCKRRMIL